ncbi:hypothetical protein [Providencia manganoxydans]|uniref:hypothetical protein n=1 Tax=Providencia manganoxydans TaxID=2923283 RepID=UPI0034E5CA38
MITPNMINAFKMASNTQTAENNHTDSNHIANKVGQAWQATSAATKKDTAQDDTCPVLTEEKKAAIVQFFSQLNPSLNPKDLPSDIRQNNFLLVYKKLSNLPAKEKECFIAEAMQMLKTPGSFENQEALKKTFEHALYRFSAVNLMNQPLSNQMNDYINSIKIDGDDEEEEFKFY